MGGKNHKALILLLCCWLTACVKDKPTPRSSATPGATGNIYIVCEGNFGSGDGSLYAYQPKQDSVFGDLYKAVNGKPLGDVFQSMLRIGDKLFLCVNNSDKVVVLNASNWTVAANISIRKPRYILQVSPARAYVSTLYSNKVFVIDPVALQLTDSFTLPGKNPEGMLLLGGNALISTWDTSAKNLYLVDATADTVLRRFATSGYAPQEALVDKEQMLWVLGGNQPQGKASSLTRIDPSTGSILASYTFPSDADALRPVFNATKDTLYFIEANYYGGINNNGIYRMSIHDAALPSTPFIPALRFQYFWALGIDPSTGLIYAGDPKGFVQKGIVYIHQPDGARVDSFYVGLGPGHFYFDQ